MEEIKKTTEKSDTKTQVKDEAQRPKKVSYELLENIAQQLSEQNHQLHAKLQELNMLNVFKRLDYLFKVVENSAVNFTPEFYCKCVEEIETIMTVPEKEQSENKE